VRTPSDGVQVDATGKVAGRGAYLCRSRSCWERALGGPRLNAALKTELTTDELAALKTWAAGLPEISEEVSYESDASSDHLSIS